MDCLFFRFFPASRDSLKKCRYTAVDDVASHPSDLFRGVVPPCIVPPPTNNTHRNDRLTVKIYPHTIHLYVAAVAGISIIIVDVCDVVF